MKTVENIKPLPKGLRESSYNHMSVEVGRRLKTNATVFGGKTTGLCVTLEKSMDEDLVKQTVLQVYDDFFTLKPNNHKLIQRALKIIDTILAHDNHYRHFKHGDSDLLKEMESARFTLERFEKERMAQATEPTAELQPA